MLYRNRLSSRLKNALLCSVILLLIQCIVTQTLQAQDPLSQIREKWKDDRHSEVIPLLLEYRKGPNGKNIEVDYMLAKSLCLTPDRRDYGLRMFQAILAHYPLNQNCRRLIERILGMYTSADVRPTSPDENRLLQALIVMAVRANTASSGIHSKIFHWLDREYAITSEPVEIIREIPSAEFTDRLFGLSDKEGCVNHVESRLGSDFRVQAFGRFVLASSSGHSASQLQRMGTDLDKVFHFFERQYGMAPPPYLITVYLVAELWEVQQLAEKLHGLRVSDAAIGYCFRDDLSIVGLIPASSSYIGTLAHELFHIMVRGNFGDIPPWMDEGMASLYEVLDISEDTVIGLPNWRGPVLEHHWDMRPSIDDLVRMDWRAFDRADLPPGHYDYEQDEQEAIRQAANHATARYFILFLQDRQKLVEVYEAFRDREVWKLETDPGTDAVNLLEHLLQRPLSEVDEDFAQWFSRLSH